ncbi:DMT family transporter [Salinicola halophyticus]|uniref:DMT family transporter n=1 Tax=Salinicola halophyticus TaxID=1808881 RepID=UPI0013002E34|nr:DMT family transporter [Salinicola halophyticus]
MKAPSTFEDNPRRGILLIVGAVFLLALADALVKYLSDSLSLWQLLVIAPSISLPILLIGWRRQNGNLPRRLDSCGWIALRSLLLLAMWIAFYAALPWIPLSIAAVGIYTTPLFIAMLAALTGEPLTGRRWAALWLGFAGVLTVLRPGGALFSPAMLLPLLAALCYAGAMVVTRTRCRDVSPWLLALGLNVAFLLAGVVGSVIVTVLVSETSSGFLTRGWQRLATVPCLLVLLYALLMVSVNTAVARAYQLAPSSLVGAFDYAYLLFATGWGFWLFGEVPDGPTLVGMATILIAGWLMIRQQSVMIAGKRRTSS